MAEPAWPEVVWDAAILRGLDARARTEIEAAGRVRALRGGEVLYRPGDPADVLYVVASGSFALHGVRRGEAESAVIRRPQRGETFGEESTVAAFATRQLEARSESNATVAELPVVVLKRAVGRAGGAPLMEKIERGLRRAATMDLLRTTSFTGGLARGDLEVFLDAARHVEVARGEHVYREGDAPSDAYVVVDGLLQAQTDDGGGGRRRIEAYLGRGDVFGDEELEARERRRVSVVASGPTWLVAIPRDVFVIVARKNGGRLDAARRLRSEANDGLVQLGGRPGQQTTAHVFRDLYRMRIARSLLVIDQDSCIRCGHCAWSCADAHEDGVSRLVRRGDKIVVDDGTSPRASASASVARPDPARARAAPLLVPNSCQHCKNPSCMIDCPTGAIGRDARGEVFIREELCTGCGSCAKACPWENIQMAPRTEGAPFPVVAVKCDLCKGKDGGPQCVASCPTQAIARIEPSEVLVELRGSSALPSGEAAPVLPLRVPAWPWAVGAALAGVGVAAAAPGRMASGILAGGLSAALTAYAALKRLRGRTPLARLGQRLPVARWLYIGHVAGGLFAFGVVVAHAGVGLPPNAGGALSIAVALALVTGAFGALVTTCVPRMLSRIERASVLPEELAARPKEIDARIFGALSGKSELVKGRFVETLRPYRRSAFGPLFLLASRRSLREEEASLGLRARGGGGVRVAESDAESARGTDELVRLIVEHRAVRAQRLLTGLLRGWLVPHLAATTAAVVLIVLHVVGVLAAARGGGP